MIIGLWYMHTVYMYIGLRYIPLLMRAMSLSSYQVYNQLYKSIRSTNQSVLQINQLYKSIKSTNKSDLQINQIKISCFKHYTCFPSKYFFEILNSCRFFYLSSINFNTSFPTFPPFQPLHPLIFQM